MAQLTEAELATYREEGLVVPSYRLPSALLSEMRAAVDETIQRNPDIRPELLSSIHIEARPDRAEGVVGGDKFLRFAMNPDILDMVTQILGPDVIFWACSLFAKPASDGLGVPWHQDGHYWPMKPLAACTVWVAIDDATPENGCMRYIPGSHKSGTLSHRSDKSPDFALTQAVEEDQFDESSAKDDVLLAGQLSIHDAHLIHGSAPNRSNKRRAGVTFRYMPATSHFDRSFAPYQTAGAGTKLDYASRPIWLVRGQNRNPRNDLAVGL